MELGLQASEDEDIQGFVPQFTVPVKYLLKLNIH